MSTAVPYTYCQVCGDRPADRHHICSRGSGGDDDDENILMLCRKHHQQFHALGWYEFGKRYPRLYGKIVSARARMGRNTTSRLDGGNDV